jgi:short-subunit dehydrogenase
MKQKIVITGASKGIGFELAKACLDNNYKIIGDCRTGKTEEILMYKKSLQLKPDSKSKKKRRWRNC